MVRRKFTKEFKFEAVKLVTERGVARADVFDYIERFYNPRGRHSKLGYISPMEFEARAMLA